MLNCQIINKHSAKNTLKTIKYYESANWATISSRERLIQVSAEVVAEPVRKKKQLSKVDTKNVQNYQKKKKQLSNSRNKTAQKCQKENWQLLVAENGAIQVSAKVVVEVRSQKIYAFVKK